MVTYESAIAEAAGLFPDHNEWDRNPEYLRGMCELIARMFALPDIHTEDRADEVREDVLACIKKGEYA